MVVLALSALGLGACGSSVSASDRIDKCEKTFLGGVAKGDSGSDSALAKAIAQSGNAKATAAQLCRDAEDAGVLNNDGDASIDDLRSVLEDNPQVLVPICESAFRAGIGKTADAVEQYLPAGADLASLAGKYCSDLGPYINDSGFDQDALFKDRGRVVLVPICVASALASTAGDSSYPFSRADSVKIFTRVCGEAWDKGLVSPDGTTDTAAVQDLAVKITRQMVNSGEVTVRQ